MQNVNSEKQGVGVREEVKMLVSFFRVGTTDKFINVAKNPSQGKNTN